MKLGIYIMLFSAILVGVTEARDILLGDANRFQNGAVVDVVAVFEQIPEWQAIESRGLTPEDADYYVLLAAANAKFYSALRSTARQRGYDMVARQGAPAVANQNLPNITQHVVDNLGGGG